jgi:hypothetical protein
MLAVLCGTSALSPTLKTPISRTFCRGSDILSTGKSVTAAEVVNVLGRWRTHEEWDTVGKLPELDELFDDKGTLKDGPALQALWSTRCVISIFTNISAPYHNLHQHQRTPPNA